MARVLFINGGSEGHINPTVGVVQELVARGEEVVYICIEAYRERLEKAGAAVRTFDDQLFIKAFISGGRRYAMERVNGLLLTADIVIPAVLEHVKGEHFDYIIHDSMFGCGRLLAQILKLPAISSCTSFAQSEADFDRMLEQFYAEEPEEITKPIRDRYEVLRAQLKEKYEVEIGSPYEVLCNPAPLTIVYTTRAFQPNGQAFDSTYQFVGPSIVSRFTPDRFDFADITAAPPIYISFGTVFNQALDFYKLCIDALGNSEHSVFMSVGSRVQAADLGEIPSNFVVRSYVPQTEFLQHAKLFITHGGMNSVHEGLYYGVPLLVIPQAADQPLIAQQVANVGAGVQLSMSSLTVNQLRDAVEQVLTHDTYKAMAVSVGESMRASGGYRLAVDEIVRYTRS